MAIGDGSTPSGENSPAATQTEQAEANSVGATQPEGAQPEEAVLPEPQFARRPASNPVTPSGDDGALFGPTTRPDEHPATGAQAPGMAATAPQKMAAWLPALRVAALDPSAPPNVVELHRLVNAILSGQVQ